MLRTDQFQRVWVDAVRTAHRTALAVLRDEESAVVARDGEVTLDLLPAAHEVLQRVLEQAPGFLGSVELGDLDEDATRREIREAVAAAFGIELAPDFGQITVFDEDKLSEVQDIVSLVEQGLRFILVATVLLGAAALLLSVDRRRTLLQLGIGTAISTYLVFTALRHVVDDVLDLVPVGQNRDGARAAADVIARGLRERAWQLLAVGLVVGAGAYLAGPGRVPVRVRNALRAAPAKARRPVHVNVDVLRVAGVVVAVLVLLRLEQSWAAFLIVLALVGAFEFALVWVDRADAQ